MLMYRDLIFHDRMTKFYRIESSYYTTQDANNHIHHVLKSLCCIAPSLPGSLPSCACRESVPLACVRPPSLVAQTFQRRGGRKLGSPHQSCPWGPEFWATCSAWMSSSVLVWNTRRGVGRRGEWGGVGRSIRIVHSNMHTKSDEKKQNKMQKWAEMGKTRDTKVKLHSKLRMNHIQRHWKEDSSKQKPKDFNV